MPTITWEDPATGAYRACQLCDHGTTSLQGGRFCVHPEAPVNHRAVVFCRAPGGFCGPDAKHLTFPGLHAPLPPIRFDREAA